MHGEQEVVVPRPSGAQEDRLQAASFEFLGEESSCLTSDRSVRVEREHVWGKLNRERTAGADRFSDWDGPTVALIFLRDEDGPGARQGDGGGELLAAAKLDHLRHSFHPDRPLVLRRHGGSVRRSALVRPLVGREAAAHALREDGQLGLDQLKDAMPVGPVSGLVGEDGRLCNAARPVEDDGEA
jgi:hypothetical protein